MFRHPGDRPRPRRFHFARIAAGPCVALVSTALLAAGCGTTFSKASGPANPAASGPANTAAEPATPPAAPSIDDASWATLSRDAREAQLRGDLAAAEGLLGRALGAAPPGPAGLAQRRATAQSLAALGEVHRRAGRSDAAAAVAETVRDAIARDESPPETVKAFLEAVDGAAAAGDGGG